MRARAAQLGFDLSVLRPVQQQGCTYPGGVAASSTAVVTAAAEIIDPGTAVAEADSTAPIVSLTAVTGEGQVVEPNVAASTLPEAAAGVQGVAEGLAEPHP